MNSEGWIIAPLPDNEIARLSALHDYNVLDTDAEECFDRITRLVSNILKTPISLISLVDGHRQWFKSHHGLAARETARDLAFCAHSILSDEVMVVEDATKDPRFKGNPLVTAASDIRFYAGAPLITASGHKLGTLCAIDRQVHSNFSEMDKKILSDLAALVIDELELRLAQQKSVHASKAKSRFVSNISHEIRTPMNVISGFCNMLADTKLDIEQQELLNTIRISNEGLLEVIDNVLDISRIESEKLELESIPFSLKNITEEVMKLFSLKAREKQINLVINHSAILPETFIGDPCRIRQIIINLLGNAIKFTDHGFVCVSMDYKSSSRELYYEVKDTGIGMNEAAIKKIFGEFQQADTTINRRYGGSGLGLSITRKLLQAMGSDLMVKSIEGEGSSFSFTLQIPADIFSSTLKKNPHSMSLPEHLHILVVEDMVLNQRIMKNALEKMNCTLDITNNGLEALKAIEHNHYDAIFMDVQMPEMDGLEATAKIRAMEASNPKRKRQNIIALTASALDEDRNACFDAGMDDFVSKPLQPEKLQQALARILQEKIFQGKPLEMEMKFT